MSRKRKKKFAGFNPAGIQIGTKRVEDPDWARDHDGAKANPRFTVAQINVKESAITVLESRGLLHPAQVRAADRFRKLWEQAGGAGAGAMDYTKEPVDGGGCGDPISDQLVSATLELDRCRSFIGVRGYHLVASVAGEGRTIEDMAGAKQRDRYSVTDALRGYLEDLAVMWHMANFAQPERFVVRK